MFLMMESLIWLFCSLFSLMLVIWKMMFFMLYFV